MFEKLISKITNAIHKPQFDPAIFQDPIAMTTDWTPLAGGGSNFKTATLHKLHDQRIEFRASTGMKAFAALFMVFGLGIFTAFTYAKITSTQPNEPAQWFPIGMGLIFASVGAGLLYNACIPVAFDLNHGYFCKNRKKPEFTMEPSRIKNYTPLENVHALQIIAERCTSKNSSYMSYELNLVLKDGSRLNAIDHGNQQVLRADAQTIASFINKPLWDVC